MILNMTLSLGSQTRRLEGGKRGKRAGSGGGKSESSGDRAIRRDAEREPGGGIAGFDGLVAGTVAT